MGEPNLETAARAVYLADIELQAENETLKTQLAAHKACVKRLLSGWWPDYVHHPEGRWARYSIDSHAVVLEPFTEAEQKVLSRG